MTVKRDYGGFSKACEKYFSPMISHLGFEGLGGAKFGRKKDGWYDAVGLQQSGYGGGDFCINVGIWIPALTKLWQAEDNFSLLLHSRLSSAGIQQGDCWLPADNKEALLSSLREAAIFLENVENWFARLTSMSIIADAYLETTHLSLERRGRHEWMHQLSAANYGFLLFLADRNSEALLWLKEAERLMVLPIYFLREGGMVHEKVKFARLSKPDSTRINQLNAVRILIGRIETAG